MNIVQRPDGIRIALLFVLGILVVSFALPAPPLVPDPRDERARSTTPRSSSSARRRTSAPSTSWRTSPAPATRLEYRIKAKEERRDSNIPGRASIIFLEVEKTDSSDFEEDLVVRGIVRHGFRVLEVASGNVPNTIAIVLLQIRNLTGVVPHIYFEWTEGNPVSNMFRFLVSGEGEVAPVTREVLRETEPDVRRRPDGARLLALSPGPARVLPAEVGADGGRSRRASARISPARASMCAAVTASRLPLLRPARARRARRRGSR